jgi:pyruvate ferredoxin oxidoreductase gamma subunit
MFQVRLHGRGGQGVVTGAEMLSIAAFLEGKHAQAFPSFGSERMGAPVMAFCRMDDKEIRLREPVMRPDALIIQDPTLLNQVNVFEGIGASSFILINSVHSFDELKIGELVRDIPAGYLCTVAATELAIKHVGRPIPNSALLGGFAAVTRQLKLESVIAAIRKKFPGKVGEGNIAAATEAYESVMKLKEHIHA